MSVCVTIPDSFNFPEASNLARFDYFRGAPIGQLYRKLANRLRDTVDSVIVSVTGLICAGVECTVALR